MKNPKGFYVSAGFGAVKSAEAETWRTYSVLEKISHPESEVIA
jgi:hypothetical protein